MTEPAFLDDDFPDEDTAGHPGAFEAGSLASPGGEFDDAFHQTDGPEADGFDEDGDDDEEVDEYAEEGDDGLDEATKIRLAAALADIDAKFGRPPAEQVEAFTEAHQQLQATLNRIDMP